MRAAAAMRATAVAMRATYACCCQWPVHGAMLAVVWLLAWCPMVGEQVGLAPAAGQLRQALACLNLLQRLLATAAPQ